MPPQTSPRFYSGRPFGKFFALLSQERCVVEETLRWFEKLWTVMTAAEEQATDEPYLRKFLASLQFPGYTVDRELLISLAETHFQAVPADMRAELMQASCGPFSTKVNEDGVGAFAAGTRQSKSGTLGREARWHRLITSNLMEEADRSQVDMTKVDKYVAPKDLKASLFDCMSGKPSIDDADLKQIYEGGTQWTSSSLDAYDLIPDATSALLQSDGDVSALRKVWLSILAQRKTLLVKRNGQHAESTLVCGSSHFGVIGMQVTVKVVGRHRVMMLDSKSQTQVAWRQLSITQLDDWHSFGLKFMPPACAKRLVGDGEFNPAGLVAIVDTSAESTLVKFAAKRGVRGLSVSRLKDPIGELSIGCDRVSALNELQAMTVLLGHLFDGITKEEVQAILQQRWQKRQVPYRSEINSETLAELRAELPDEDVAEAENDLKAHAKVAAPTAAPSSAKRSAAKASAAQTQGGRGGRKVPAKPKKPDIHAEEVGAESARAYLPAVKGCGIHKEVFHQRWKVQYPRNRPPFSSSQVFVVGMRKSLLHCLRWAWDAHLESTGEPCPWDLSD